MNFFKSILSDETLLSPPQSSPNASQALKPSDHGNPVLDPSTDNASDGWSFGGLMKTFTARSESVLDTYRRDLKEFGSGLRSETENLREAASRAVKDLPAAAHGSLESVSHALDEVVKSTAGIISKESPVFASDGESETVETRQRLDSRGRSSWFESQLGLIQNDVNTFCREPEDADEYSEWNLGFDLGEKRCEIEKLIWDNGALESVYKRVVVGPGAVDHETFWCRYFYRVHKLEQQGSVRGDLMKRANLDDDDEEELSWDVDDDDNGDGRIRENSGVKNVEGIGSAESGDGTLSSLGEQEGSSSRSHDVVEVKIDQKMASEGTGLKKDDAIVSQVDIQTDFREKGESLKKNDSSAEGNEEDLEWDEIEDVGSGDEKKLSGARGGGANMAELRKRLSTAEVDEDLSWDIEDDDDEPVKKA